ncbi:reverse transcriptase domain-containing protein [Tanacetum coccineum]
MAPKQTTRSTPVTPAPTTTTVTNAQLQAMIDQGVTNALAARDANRSTNGDDSHTSGIGVRRNERATHECTYPDFLKCQPLNFKGTQGVVELTQWMEKMETVFRISNYSAKNQIKFSTCTLLGNALTWWNSHVKTAGNDIAYAITWTKLKKKMTNKSCPRIKIKKLEVELWNLKVKENKRKQDDNQQHQQENKEQNNWYAHYQTAESGISEKEGITGDLKPLFFPILRCRITNDGLCAPNEK